MGNMDVTKLILMLLPVIILQYALIAVALIDLYRRKKVRFNNKIIWVIIIIAVQIIGPVVYFLARGDEE